MAADNPFVIFMSNPSGRMTRVVAGVILALLGLFVAPAGIARDVLIGLGVIVFLAGAVERLPLRSAFRRAVYGERRS